jgi:hypothetical protein
MSRGDFQDRVNDMLGKDYNIHVDRPHGDKPCHVDLTKILPLPDLGGADKVAVDQYGNVVGGSTQIGKFKYDWEKEQ